MARRVYVGVGSNCARESNTRSSVQALRARFGAVQLSPVYDSPAEGFDGDPFYNLVVLLHTDEPLAAVQTALREIEQAHGRNRASNKFVSRALDLDLLTYGDLQQAESPCIPRDDILRYAFVLRPLADLAPDDLHPVLHRSYASLWQAFEGPADLHRVELAL